MGHVCNCYSFWIVELVWTLKLRRFFKLLNVSLNFHRYIWMKMHLMFGCGVRWHVMTDTHRKYGLSNFPVLKAVNWLPEPLRGFRGFEGVLQLYLLPHTIEMKGCIKDFGTWDYQSFVYIDETNHLISCSW